MRHVRLLVILGIAALGACDRPTDIDAADGALTALPRPPYLVLENATDRTVYHAVFDGAIVDEIMWLACADPSCPGIEPGARDSVHYDSITSGDGDVPVEEAVVYWWHLVEREPGEFMLDSMRTVHVDL